MRRACQILGLALVLVEAMRVGAFAQTLPPERSDWSFPRIEVRAALRLLAQISGLNVVTSEGVSGTVQLQLKQVSWEEVLAVIAQSKGLYTRREGRILWVSTRQEAAAREAQSPLLGALPPASAPVEVWVNQSFALHHARASEVQSRLPLSPKGKAMADVRTNQLWVTDTEDRLAQIAAWLQRIDVPVQQVMIEARIVQAQDNFGRALGVRLGGNLTLGGRLAVGSSAATASAAAAGVSWAAPGLAGVAPANLPVALFNADRTHLLQLELSALQADGRGQLVSNPQVVTADQTKAVIEQGTELPYQVSAANGATAVAFRKANLRLEVTPRLVPGGGITLELDISKDSVGQTTPAGFAIDTKHINTQVLVEDGGTVMIGGIFETVSQTDVQQLPGLGDWPLLGRLFSQRRQTSARQELLVFITPKMLVMGANTR